MPPEQDESKKKAPPTAEETTQRLHVDLLFSKYVSRDLSEELTNIADFFSFLSEQIIPPALMVGIPHDLLERFEPVYLLLLDKLNLYPVTIKAQVEDIARQSNICDLMAITGIFKRNAHGRLRRFGFWHSFLRAVSLDMGVKVTLNDNTTLRVTSDTLFRLQVALKRLAGIIRYASSIEFVDYDETFHKFKRNYDPDLMDRSKLLALLNILRMEVNAHPTSDEKSLLLTKLEHIEQELKRPKVRWGVVITSVFILFGFLADLKTLDPCVYEKPCQIVQQILSVLHTDGLVSNKPPQLLAAQDDKRESGNGDEPMDDHVALPPRKREEE